MYVRAVVHQCVFASLSVFVCVCLLGRVCVCV